MKSFSQSSQSVTRRTRSENEIGNEIVDSAYKVHVSLGPGLLESFYEQAMIHELTKRGLLVEQQKDIPATYDGKSLGTAFRADLIIENKVLVELKSVESIQPIHKKQTLTYLKLSGMRLGYLINFNTDLIKKAITRIVNGLPESFASLRTLHPSALSARNSSL